LAIAVAASPFFSSADAFTLLQSSTTTTMQHYYHTLFPMHVPLALAIVAKILNLTIACSLQQLLQC